MPERVTPEQVHTWFKGYFRARPDVGFWKAIMDLILEPRNPFEPEKWRRPKLEFLIGAGLFAAAVGWFAYFNLTR